jgi:hypothetical protein
MGTMGGARLMVWLLVVAYAVAALAISGGVWVESGLANGLGALGCFAVALILFILFGPIEIEREESSES